MASAIPSCCRESWDWGCSAQCPADRPDPRSYKRRHARQVRPAGSSRCALLRFASALSRSQLAQCLLQCCKIERLLQQHEPFLDRVTRAGSEPCGEEHGDLWVELADSAAKVEPVHSAGHQHIGEYEIDVVMLGEPGEGVLRAGKVCDLIPKLLEIRARNLGDG